MTKRTPYQLKNLHAALVFLVLLDEEEFYGQTFTLDADDNEMGCLIHHLFHSDKLPSNTAKVLNSMDDTMTAFQVFYNEHFIAAIEKDYGPGAHHVFTNAAEEREEFLHDLATFIKTGQLPE